jgi:hypothetical protein
MLGPLEVRAGSGELLEVGGARLRTLLIMLALRPGQLVPASQLIDGLWPEDPPAGAPNALQALVSRLRRALPEAVIESRPAGPGAPAPPRPPYCGVPAVRPHERGEDPDRGRLPRAVRPEQAEYGAGGNREVDPVQRPGLAEPLDQPVSND